VAGEGGISVGGTTGEQQEDEGENEGAERAAEERCAMFRRRKDIAPNESHRNASSGRALHIADLCIELWSPALGT